VIRMRALEEVRADVDRVAALASARAGYVVLMPAGNVGNARFFAPPVSWLMTARSRTLHEFVRAAAMRHQAAYVNLFMEARADPFVANPGLSAPDGLHPGRGLPGLVPRVDGANSAGRPAREFAEPRHGSLIARRRSRRPPSDEEILSRRG